MPNKYLDSVQLGRLVTKIKSLVSTTVANYLPLTGGSITGNLSVSGTITGDVTGDVTGNVTGDVTGNVTGNVAGNVTGNVTGDVTGTASGNLPLSGGTMTGTIIPGFPAIKQGSNEYNVTLAGGADTIAEAGAKLILYGADSTDTGNFVVQAGNSGGYKQLIGKPSGEFTWGGSNVAVMGTLQNGHGILKGNVSNISVSGNSYATGTVSFGQTFSSAPMVVTCCGYGHAYVIAGCHSISTTGFSYIVSNENAATYNNERINWIAIG